MAVVCCVLLCSVCSSLHTILTNLPLHKSYTAHILPRKIQLRIGKKRYNPEEERVRLLSSFEWAKNDWIGNHSEPYRHLRLYLQPSKTALCCYAIFKADLFIKGSYRGFPIFILAFVRNGGNLTMDNTNEREDKTLNAASAGKLLPKKVKAKTQCRFWYKKKSCFKKNHPLMPKIENNRNPQPVPTTNFKCETVPQLF